MKMVASAVDSFATRGAHRTVSDEDRRETIIVKRVRMCQIEVKTLEMKQKRLQTLIAARAIAITVVGFVIVVAGVTMVCFVLLLAAVE